MELKQDNAMDRATAQDYFDTLWERVNSPKQPKGNGPPTKKTKKNNNRGLETIVNTYISADGSTEQEFMKNQRELLAKCEKDKNFPLLPKPVPNAIATPKGKTAKSMLVTPATCRDSIRGPASKTRSINSSFSKKSDESISKFHSIL